VWTKLAPKELLVQLVIRIGNFLRNLRQVWGTAKSKQALWDKEFAEGRWSCLDHTEGDCVYRFIEKHCNGGDILDLGCGAGNTGVELKSTKYSSYIGVDVSEVALQKARLRCAQSQRSDKNFYVQSAIETYVPSQKFDVILFRECLFYIGRWRIKSVLTRYADYLSSGGVLIVRLYDSKAFRNIVRLIETTYEIVEKHVEPNDAIVLTFRKRRRSPAIVGPVTSRWWFAVMAILAYPEESLGSEAVAEAYLANSSRQLTSGRRARRRTNPL
jgi:SAM-dependent methyltransferase